MKIQVNKTNPKKKRKTKKRKALYPRLIKFSIYNNLMRIFIYDICISLLPYTCPSPTTYIHNKSTKTFKFISIVTVTILLPKSPFKKNKLYT